MTKQISVAFLGLGDHACRSHFEPLLHNQNVVIGGIFDLNHDKIREEIAKHKLQVTRIYQSVEELYGDPSIDAVIIGTPDRFHADNLLGAIKGGKHVLVEKPVAHTIEDFDKINLAFELAKEKNLIITSCHPRRFDPPFLWVKSHLSDFIKKYGEVIELTYDFSYHAPSKVGLHIGLLDDHFNHEIDLIHYLLGKSAYQAHNLYNDEVRYHVAGQRHDGITFYVRGTRMLNNSIYPESLMVRFARADLRLQTKTGGTTIRDHDNQTIIQLDSPATDYEKRFVGVNGDFIDAILNQSDPYLTESDIKNNTLSGLHLTRDGHYTHTI